MLKWQVVQEDVTIIIAIILFGNVKNVGMWDAKKKVVLIKVLMSSVDVGDAVNPVPRKAFSRVMSAGDFYFCPPRSSFGNRIKNILI